MAFERPFLIVIGILFLIAAPFLLRLVKDALVIETPLGPPGGAPFKPPYSFSLLIKLLRIAEFAGVFLLFIAAIAAAGPLLLSSRTVWLSRGADIIFVLDASPSMACIDMNGRNRFDASRALIRDFVERRAADNIGIVAVGKDASLLVPPTADRAALLSRLDSLRMGELGDGTALGLGLAIAALHISGSDAARKAVVLITDGENNAGSVNPTTAAEIFPSLDANLWVIAVGSTGEIPIDYVDPFTKVRRTGFFNSRFDPENIRLIAERGGGFYIGAPSADTFAEAFSRLDRAELSIPRSGTLTTTESLHTPFLAAAALLLVLVRFIRRYIAGVFL